MINVKRNSKLPRSSSHGKRKLSRTLSERLHIDGPLLLGIITLLTAGLVILYSADNQNLTLLFRQSLWIVIAFIIMLVLAQIPPERYYQWAPGLYIAGTFLLVVVLLVGHVGKGAQRWINLGIFRFQPSELMKIAMPMMLAWYLNKKPLPPKPKAILLSVGLLLVPVLLVAKQPDLGTALIIAFTGASVLLLAGIGWRLIVSILALVAASAPVLWHFLHGYQRDRVLTFLNPERDPLGAGYHIIQSKIAIGSGGIFGKGYLQGTQSHLQFLPEHATDFIFGVCGEEFGLLGSAVLIIIFLSIVLRCLYISSQAQDTFSRLLAGSLSLIFFISFFINMGMVTGILPVVGIPLPLVSYGGTAMITILAGFGIIMSIHTHRKLVSR